jgi:hypothetical protein
MINDDKPFVHVTEDGAFVCSSPWRGKHNLGVNITAAIKAICFVARGESDRIVPIPPSDAIGLIFNQLPRYSDPESTQRLLGLVDRLLSDTPLYRLECTPTVHAAETAFFGMNGDKA